MKLLSINIGGERQQQRKDYVETTGIYKTPVEGPVEIKSLGIEGDAICDKKNHGGPDQALYLYGGADYTWWEQELGKDLAPGTFGDNLTVSNIESASFNVGDYIRIGEVTLQVTAPRIPCGTFATRMGDPQWVKKFRAAERPGLYVRVIKEGVVKAGDPVTIEKYTGETVSIVQMYRDHYTKEYTEESLRHYLNSPIDIRSRKDLEEEFNKLFT
ncbi:MAG: MOSC domain-containing protein [Anaerolineales bacterium]|nr:MOSC domain-containing protein [Anaerolineae bacterium]PWB73710.1 MAG: MOSC domain-containing protein [Anaerolineales bacterium]